MGDVHEVDEGGMTRPSDVGAHRSSFDSFAEWAANLASRGPFFSLCLFGLVLWLTMAGVVMDYSDRWIELGAFGMAAITFLLIALLENAQRRSDQAVQRKLNAIAEGIAELMERQDMSGNEVDELRAAVGLEHREATN
ncbi:MAG TPA: low affinity iron permease family protein [Acidimicrobiales bacterium]|nr:low affinity iron permease family protein [Acidimicrobiales bacterium]